MKKFSYFAVLSFLFAILAISCGGKKDDPYNYPDSDSSPYGDQDAWNPSDSDVVPDGDPSHRNDEDTARDCNYSSTDNRIRPKDEDLVFSGIIYGEQSLTKYVYFMNRCYECNVNSPLMITNILIVDENGIPDAGSFVISDNPLENGPVSLQHDEELRIGVYVTATTWSDQVRYLRVQSNDKCKPNYDMPITAQTKPSGKIVVKTVDDSDPDDGIMVFSDVSGELVNRIEVKNVGTTTLRLSSVAVTENQSRNTNEFGFFVQDAPTSTIQILAGESATLNIGCRNDKEYPTPLSGELTISNTDPTEYGVNSEYKLTLKCGPNAEKSPTALLKCEPEKISVLQWAVMDGSDSVDSDGQSKEGLRYLWSFASTPGGISLDIVDEANRAGSALNGDSSNKISTTAFQARVKGTYIVRLIVINESGITSKPAQCTVEAVSDDDLTLKLLWNNKDADLDLHLIAPEGSFGDNATDCYYWNCSPQYSGEKPDWGEIGEPKDDPNLDIDNTTGMGPETITINKPVNGTYKVTVHAYDLSHGPATAVVKGYAHSKEAESVSLLMNKTDTCWDVYKVTVSDGESNKKAISFEPIVPAAVYDCAKPTH